MSTLSKCILMLLSIPNTLRFNFHYFNLKKAIRFPVLVSNKVRLKSMGAKGDLICPDKTACIKIGFSDGTYGMGKGKKSTFSQQKGTKIVFEGKATICNPVYLTVNHSGVVKFGSNFQSNTNFVLSSANAVTFGADCLVAWNVILIDGDGHSIYLPNSDKRYNDPKPIIIGNHVWIGSNVTILKGSKVADGDIISSGAIVSGVFDAQNVIIGGVPAKILKRDVLWEEEWL